MSNRQTNGLVGSIFFVLLTACSWTVLQTPSLRSSWATSLGTFFRPSYAIIEAMNGQTLSPQLGQGVNLTLPGNPDANQDWVIEEFDPTILQPQGTVQYNAPAMEGAEERLQWRFIAGAEGETKLRLARRGDAAWEALKPFEVTIRVGE